VQNVYLDFLIARSLTVVLYTTMSTTRAEIAAAEATKALRWTDIYGPEYRIPGDASLIVGFFRKTAELSRSNGTLATFLLSGGHVVPSANIHYTDNTESAYIHIAMVYMRSATTAPGVGRLTFIPSETIAAIHALPAARRPLQSPRCMARRRLVFVRRQARLSTPRRPPSRPLLPPTLPRTPPLPAS